MGEQARSSKVLLHSWRHCGSQCLDVKDTERSQGLSDTWRLKVCNARAYFGKYNISLKHEKFESQLDTTITLPTMSFTEF